MCILGCFRHVPVSVTLSTVTRQAPLSVGFSRQEYWSGLPCPPPGNLPNPGIELASLISPALAERFYTASATWEAQLGGCRPVFEALLQSSSSGFFMS